MVSVRAAREPLRARRGGCRMGEARPGLETGSHVQLLERGFVLGPGPSVTGVTRSGKQTGRASGDPSPPRRGACGSPREGKARADACQWGRPGAR